MYEELSDADLLIALRSAREEEKQQILLALYDRHKHVVLRCCYSYLADYEMANDILHDVFVKVIEKVGTLNNPAVFKSWLMQITRNLCVDHLRRSSYIKGEEPLTAYIEVFREDRTEDKLIAELDREKILKQLSACVRNLDSFQLSVFRLRWQGLRASQIVTILKTEKSELRRCYDRIKSILEGCMKNKGFQISIDQIISLGEIDE